MVRRRNVVQSLGAGLLALAGCVTSEEGNPTGSTHRKSTEPTETTTGTAGSATSEASTTTDQPPATGSEASVDDIVVTNWTDESHRVELVVTPVTDASNPFTDEFTLGPYDEDETDTPSDTKVYPDVEQIDEECRVEVTVDDERSATGHWGGDARDYKGLRIHVDYEEIDIAEKVV